MRTVFVGCIAIVAAAILLGAALLHVMSTCDDPALIADCVVGVGACTFVALTATFTAMEVR